MIQKTALIAIGKERRLVVLLLLSTIVNSVTIVGQAWYFATLINNLIFQEGTWHSEYHTIVMLAIMVLLRLLSSYYSEHLSSTLGTTVKEILRKRALDHTFRLGLQRGRTQGDIIHLLTDGLDQVDAYVANYIPQMAYAVIIPLVMGIAIMDTLPIIGFILIGTVPLIPFFMILIGKQAEKMNQEQWERMSFLSGHFLDVLRGMTTLILFGRSKEQTQVISRLSQEFKDSTLRVLRVAFISALVLELVSTISTAIIAVYLGITLLEGHIAFFPAFFILLLAPEFYAPFRQLGAAFHTGMAGKASLEQYDAFMEKQTTLLVGGTHIVEEPIESITFNDVSYTYDGSSNGIFHMSFAVRRNEPLMFVGESGAGKSTIAHLMGGLLTPPKESVFVNGHDIHSLSMDWWRTQMAYVSQKPHIMKGSLRDCITFGRSVDDAELLQVIEAAELKELVAEKGLNFSVGEGGLGLSGGEMQRIALARAFLQNPQVLILDEVTAHLDIKTESAIGRALQRLMANRIVILIGHRLQTMSWAKHIVVLREGMAVESGTYDELVAWNGYFTELIKAGMGALEESYHEEHRYHTSTTQGNEERRDSYTDVNQDINKDTDTDKDIDIDNQMVLGRKDSGTNAPSCDTGFSTSHRRPAYKGWLLLLSVLSPAKWSLVLALLFTFVTVFMNVGLLSVSSWLLASAALQPGITYLSLAIVGVRFFGISRAVSRYFERYTSHRMAFQGLYGLRVWFYTKLEPLAPSIFRTWGAGDLLGRIMADIEVLQFFYLRTLIPPLSAFALTALVAYGVGTVDTNLSTLVWGAAIVAGLVLPYGVYRYHRPSLEQISSAQGRMKSYMGDALDSMEDIISYNRVPHTIHHIQSYMDDRESHSHRIARGMNLGNTLFLGIVQMVVIVTAVVAAHALVGPWASVMVAVCAIGVQAWFESLQPMIIAIHHGYESLVAVRRLLAIQDTPNPVHQDITEDIEVLDTIRIEGLSFGYDPEHLVYDDLNMTILQGQKVAIVGSSGSGKTTLFSTLERFYDYSGSIRIGNTDLKDISISSWRQLLGTITQHTYIFHATFEDNIRLAKPQATAEELDAAIKRASLQSVVDKLPNGLQTMVGNGGVGLSGGERQRVALARLFLKQPQLILLDEPLEGLDQLRRRELHQQIVEFSEGKTLLYITHHLEGLEAMDRVVFMEHGRILEEGTFTELIKQRGAFYEYCHVSMAGI